MAYERGRYLQDVYKRQEYHLLEDGSIGYYSSEGGAGRLAESMDDLFSLIVSCICWHDYCDAKEYADSKTLEEYGQRRRNCNLEDIDMDLSLIHI